MNDLVQALGDRSDDLLLTEPAEMVPFLRDRTGQWPGHSLAVGRPRNTADVSMLVSVATKLGYAIIPQGGNTGVTGGSAGGKDQRSLLISLQRMRAIRALETGTPAVVAEAGCILSDVQAAVASHEFQIALGLGSEGSATVGGLVSTNAGGIRALRYGVMRSQVLGLEVVLPDGQIWNGLRTVLKNNMGYDLKHIFVGAEGTLGIITAAALKLSPSWQCTETAMIGIGDPQAALDLLASIRHSMGDVVVACELIQYWGMELAISVMPGVSLPFDEHYQWYILMETATPGKGLNLREEFEKELTDLLKSGTIKDAVIAESEAQRQALWRFREAIVDGKRRAGPGLTVDIAVPPGKVPEFIESAYLDAEKIAPGCRPLAFGHVGDGNIHFSIYADPQGNPLPLLALTAMVEINTLNLGGSICAEHGVGRKMQHAVFSAVDQVEHDLFTKIKRALDPDNKFNPGAVINMNTNAPA